MKIKKILLPIALAAIMLFSAVTIPNFFGLATEVKAEPTAASIDFSGGGYTNGQVVESAEIDSNVTVSFDKGTNKSNAPKYYTTGTAMRAYGGNCFTVAAAEGYNITGITFTFSSGEGTNTITADSGTFTQPTWSGSANSVTFTIDGTSGHRRIKVISVTYEAAAADPCASGHTLPNPTYTCVDQVCTVCEKTITHTTEHNFASGVCTVCGTLDPNACAHTNVTPATCTEASTCDDCGAEIAEALGHNLVAADPSTAQAVTCTTAGRENGKECSRCEYTELGATIDAPGHNFVDGVCTVCGEPKPTYSGLVAEGQYYIYHVRGGIKYYLNKEDTNNSAPAAVTDISQATLFTFTLIADNQYHISCASGLLYSTSSNNGLRVAEDEKESNGSVWTITEGSQSNGAYDIKNVGQKRYIALYNASDFRTYTSATAANRSENTDLEQPCTHANTTHNDATDATCTTAGTVEYWECDDCGKKFSNAELTAEINDVTDPAKPAAHSWAGDYTIDLAATCTVAGSKSIHCTVCSEKKDVTAIPALGHNLVAADPSTAQAATCTTAGRENGKECSRCEYTELGATIDALGHNLVAADPSTAQAATCTTAGRENGKECSRCEYTELGATIDALGHNLVAADPSTAQAATCTTAGRENGKECLRCEYTELGATIDALGHTWGAGDTCNVCGVHHYLRINGATLALGSDLGIRYYVSREAVDTNGYTELRLVIGANEYDSFSIETVGGKQYYVFTYTGILPQNVGQDVSATLKATNGGGEIESPAFVYSVKTYCYNKLESSTNSGFKGMLVDLLNYCAAAQTYFGEIDANLVNRDLTVEQKALGTASYEATGVANTSDKGSIDSVAVLLGNSIQLKVFFTAADPTGYSLEVMCNSTTKTYTECQPAGEAGKYYFIVDGLKTADIGNDMIIELKNASNVSEGIISYNLDAYYNEIMADAGATELTKKLVAAMMKFIGAAEAYFAS